MQTGEQTKLMVRLPADVHQKLRESAEAHDRSLNKEIVHALRRYVERVTEIHYVWDDDEQTTREWLAGAGATLGDDEGWDFTDEEGAEVERLLEAQR